jgi:hypothetical protein
VFEWGGGVAKNMVANNERKNAPIVALLPTGELVFASTTNTDDVNNNNGAATTTSIGESAAVPLINRRLPNMFRSCFLRGPSCMTTAARMMMIN